MTGLATQSEGTAEREGDTMPATIVVPIDDAKLASRALVIARRWAAALGSDLVVVSVEGEADRADLLAGLDESDEIPTRWQTVSDRDGLVPAVVDFVSEHAATAVCAATRAHSPLVDVVSDDVAQQVLRAVAVPVVLIGPHCRTDALDGPVVVAHDGSRGGHPVLDAARVWAGALGVRSIVLHVHQPLGEEPTDVMPVLDAAREQLGGAPLEVARSSFPAGAIRDYAHEVYASLLALSTRGRTDTLTASTGRTATWIVRESPCPVLVAHPPADRAP